MSRRTLRAIECRYFAASTFSRWHRRKQRLVAANVSESGLCNRRFSSAIYAAIETFCRSLAATSLNGVADCRETHFDLFNVQCMGFDHGL